MDLRSGSTTWERDERGRTSDGEWEGGQGVSMSRLSILASILKDARKQRRETGRHTSEDLRAAAPKEGLPRITGTSH